MPSKDSREHSPVGPSSGKRWMNCSASVRFTDGMADISSGYAAEGTAAHTLSEWVREQGKPAKFFKGREIEAKGEIFIVDNEMANAVQRFVDYVEQFPGDAYYEQRVHYTVWVDFGWGTADDIRIDEPVCYITDLKYGKGVQVFLKDDPQLRLYALGVFQEFSHLYDIEEFRLAIHQPRLDHIDEQTLSVKDLLIWARDEVRPAYERTLDSESNEFKAGDWCRWCPGKQVCEARALTYVDDFESINERLDEIPNYRLAEILAKIPEIRAWCNDMEARARSEIQRGNPVGDWKFVEGRSWRKWKNTEEAEKALRRVSKLKVADIFEKELIGPSQAEKLLGKEHSIIKDHVYKPPGKPVLVSGSDPRPTLQVKAEDEFENLDKA